MGGTAAGQSAPQHRVKFKKQFFKMADDDLDAMLADLDNFEVSGSSSSSSSRGGNNLDIADGPIAPGYKVSPVVQSGEVVKRHDARSIGRAIDAQKGPVLIGKVPDMPETKRTVVGVCPACSKDVDTKWVVAFFLPVLLALSDVQITRSDYNCMKLGDGSVYHENCFTCTVCRKPIEGGAQKEGGRLKCANCVFVARCVRFKDDGLASHSYMAPSDTLTLHSECLSCGECKRPLNKDDAYLMRGDLLCRPCAEK